MGDAAGEEAVTCRQTPCMISLLVATVSFIEDRVLSQVCQGLCVGVSHECANHRPRLLLEVCPQTSRNDRMLGYKHWLKVRAFKSRKHASKVRLYYMLHPRDGGCPAKRLRSENGSDADMVDKNKCCTLCNMSFTSAVVADSHYQGKIHAKRLKLLLGEKTPLKTTATPLSPLKPPRMDTAPVVASPYQRRDSDRYCGLCAAWFNNPLMAQQHYDGKKHKKNAARVALLEQLGTTLDMGELRGLRRNYRCTICSVSLNSIEQYHAHLKGSKHQTNLKNK
ncbi:PREDICTED: zinc finger matrin-type protein 4 [Colobus angolensis palliatus]|nr:PREDICTED: zinc finger matrin-type protein 4 [Colobus angolensis palliatus]